ncbi:hypothetical protein I4U23_018317 [Adineta vaga]|nr:hypothetical protein I4U23_018317 [Adineta vaga]
MSGSHNGGDPYTYKKVQETDNTNRDCQKQSHGNISLSSEANSTSTDSSTNNALETNSSTSSNSSGESS